jgi:hypothetical protein
VIGFLLISLDPYLRKEYPMAEEFDGRDLIGDNPENAEFYVGVDPMYQNYANEGEKPYPFHEEEIVERARQGGIPEGEQSGFEAMVLEAPGVGEDERDDEDEPESESPKGSTSTTPAVPTPTVPPVPKS